MQVKYWRHLVANPLWPRIIQCANQTSYMEADEESVCECVVHPNVWCLQSNWKNWKSFKHWATAMALTFLHWLELFLSVKNMASWHEFENFISKGMSRESCVTPFESLWWTNSSALKVYWWEPWRHNLLQHSEEAASKEPQVAAVQLRLISCPRLLFNHFAITMMPTVISVSISNCSLAWRTFSC